MAYPHPLRKKACAWKDACVKRECTDEPTVHTDDVDDDVDDDVAREPLTTAEFEYESLLGREDVDDDVAEGGVAEEAYEEKDDCADDAAGEVVEEKRVDGGGGETDDKNMPALDKTHYGKNTPKKGSKPTRKKK